MNIYLDNKTSLLLNQIFEKFSQVKEVVLYGSRAKQTHHDRSDIDLVICNSSIDRSTLGKIKMEIDNSDIPYTVDLQIFEKLKNQDLLDHIQRVGKRIYFK
ncbi:MAG: nucleotidyltransferase domain-containing protein [Flavobacterium sp.]